MSKRRIKNKHLILYISTILFLFIIINSFPQKLNNIIKKNYKSRLNEIYGYCSGDSYGFLQMIKNKYNIEKNPIIINYKVLPNSLWAIYNPSKKFDIRPRIFLNYPEFLDLEMLPSNNNIFMSKSDIQYSSGINSLSFLLREESIRIDNDISIYKIINNTRINLFEKKINQTITSGERINVNFKTENINSRWEKIYLEIIK